MGWWRNLIGENSGLWDQGSTVMGRDDVKLGEERELIAMDGEKLLDIYLARD